MTDAFDFVAQNGIVSWNDYPVGYQGRKSSCRASKQAKKFHNNNGFEEDLVSNDRLKELVSK